MKQANLPKRADKSKVVIIVLAIGLLLALAYIFVGVYNESQRTQLQVVATQGYNIGVSDAVATAFQQTNNCQVTSITFGNFTRRIVDFDCIERALAAQQQAQGQ